MRNADGEAVFYEPGDYILSNDKERWVVSADYFAENYEEVTAEAASSEGGAAMALTEAAEEEIIGLVEDARLWMAHVTRALQGVQFIDQPAKDCAKVAEHLHQRIRGGLVNAKTEE